MEGKARRGTGRVLPRFDHWVKYFCCGKARGGITTTACAMGGEVDLVLIGPPSAMPHIQSGKLRALAVLSKERLPSLPNVPTIKEAGIDNSEVTTWYGILAPARTPREIINRLNAEWIKVAAMPDNKQK